MGASFLGGSMKNSDMLCKLRQYLGSEGWFISGSFANPRIKYYKDIDVYFYNKEKYKASIKRCMLIKTRGDYSTCSSTFFGIIGSKPVQLIHMHFGTPEEIFESIDINVCKQAVLPDGTRIKHSTADDPIKIVKVSPNSFTRLRKYIYRYKLSHRDATNILLECIDDHIHNDEVMFDYYTGKMSKYPINHHMYQMIKRTDSIVTDYFTEQALKHAPELLL